MVAASCNWGCAAVARFSFRLALAASDGIPDFLVRWVVMTTPRREPSGSLISSKKDPHHSVVSEDTGLVPEGYYRYMYPIFQLYGQDCLRLWCFEERTKDGER